MYAVAGDLVGIVPTLYFTCWWGGDLFKGTPLILIGLCCLMVGDLSSYCTHNMYYVRCSGPGTGPA